MFELLKKVLKPYGPSGNETEVAEVIQRELTGHVDSMTVDAMGNLIVVKTKKRSKLSRKLKSSLT